MLTVQFTPKYITLRDGYRKQYCSSFYCIHYWYKGKRLTFGTEEMAQLVKYLCHKQEDLRLEPQHECKKLGKVAHTCGPCAGEAKAGDCWPPASLAE